MLVALALLAVPGAVAAAADSTPSSGFYAPPSPLPAGAPGDIIRAEPTTAYLAPGVALPARAWRVLYRSTSATGAPIAVSGLVLVPTGAYHGPRPVIGYGIGSQGLANRCAPTAQFAAGTEYEAGLVASVLARGWAVALTDYPGLGTPGDHPYVVGNALGRAVLDSMRAARRLAAAALPADGPLALMGYSEGADAAGWAAQLQPSYAPDLPLAGAAIGGVPADLLAIQASLDGGPYAFLLLYTGIGFDSAYPELHLDRYLTAAGRAKVAELRGTCISDAIPTMPFQHAYPTYTTRDLASLPDWRARQRENSLGATPPSTPVLVQHARLDDVLPYPQAAALAATWCAEGANVRFAEALGANHISGANGYIGPATNFLADRFAGIAIPSPCPAHAVSARRSGPPARHQCASLRHLVFRIHQNHGRAVRVVVSVNGRRVRTAHGRRIRRVALRVLPSRAVVKIVVVTARRMRITSERRYDGCTKSRPRTRVEHL